MSDGRRSDGDELGRRIAEAKRADAAAHASRSLSPGGNKGMAVGVEFVGAVLVSTFIGWALDRWLGTKPWLMIAMLVLGFAAGIRRAMITSREIDTASNDSSR